MKNKFKKIILLLCVVLFTALSAYSFSFRNMTLDFVQISDTHISTDRDNTSYKALAYSSTILKDAINQINNIKGLDFVLFTGDLVDSATYDNYREFYSLLSKLKYPSLNTFGNHDLLYGTIGKFDVLEYVKKCNPNYRFDDTYYAFSPKSDYRIIVLDSVPEKDTGTSNGRLSDEQLRFLDNELANNKDKIVIIAMHHPSVEPFVAKEHALLNADSFNEILLKYKNPIVVLSGHYHAAKIRQFGNLVFVSTPAMVTYPMAFRHIKIVNFKDRVNYTFEFKSTGLNEIKEFNRKTVISYATLAGNEKDREISFVYHKNCPKSAGYKRNKIKNAAKTTKTSKREIKKLTEPKKQQQEKSFFKSKKANKPDNEIKKTNVKKQNTQEKKQKVKNNKKSLKERFKKNKAAETDKNQEVTNEQF